MRRFQHCWIRELPRNASVHQSRSFKFLQLPSSSFACPLTTTQQRYIHSTANSFLYSSNPPIAMSSEATPASTTNTTDSTTVRPSTPPEKRVIHSQNPTSPPPETSAAKKVKMSDETTTPSISTATEAPAVVPVSAGPALLIKKLNDKARAPKRGSAFAAGYDLYASEDTVVPKGGKALVETGLSMAVPDGTYGRIAPRSGLASKNFIDTGAGVIDADYRGPVKILLFNHSDVDFEIKEGDRVAQLILERIYTPEVAVVEDLEASVRGAGGFGSSGR
ncbi:Deoxyuridine 5'-triphosphate nucleotidohydrolase [Arthrobotrys conoides]|uniref:Deoxyuridine 5'-triphosphate nucleotidohydrolase n=1 Tax=Arthrobotrys conoides TaxID=74498 RepID=A0AAN8NVD7_9PEZI